MTKYLLIILLLFTSCATDYRRAQAKAVADLTNRGYDLSQVSHSPEILIKETKKEVSAEWFMRTGKYRTIPGFYVPAEQLVVVYKNVPEYVAEHEYKHHYLSQLGIPVNRHHGIMGAGRVQD